MRFEAKAQWYAERSTVQRVVADWLVECVESDVAPLSALEFGAGPGLLTCHLASRGFRSLLATDVAPAMVMEGRKRVPGALWQVEDAWSPSGRRVDRIYSCSLLQWAESPVDVLVRWRQMLRPGGRVTAALFIEGSMAEVRDAAPGFEAVSWRGAEAWLAHVESAGLRITSSATRRDTFYYRDAMAALRSVHGIGAVGPRRLGVGAMRAMLRRIDGLRPPGKAQALTWESLRFVAEL